MIVGQGSPRRAVGVAHARWLWLIVPIVLVPVLWHLLFVNPLPSDEELIAHFNAHRPEIEELVKRYRDYERPAKPLHEWGRLPEIQALKRKASIKWVAYSGSALWLPNPYAPDMPARVRALQKSLGTRVLSAMRKYGAVQLVPSDPRYGLRPAIVRGTFAVAIWKDLYVFPEKPKILEGVLWEPVASDGKSKFQWRVLPSLDGYPPAWKKGECVLRAIDARWYIRMCWGAT